VFHTDRCWCCREIIVNRFIDFRSSQSHSIPLSFIKLGGLLPFPTTTLDKLLCCFVTPRTKDDRSFWTTITATHTRISSRFDNNNTPRSSDHQRRATCSKSPLLLFSTASIARYGPPGAPPLANKDTYRFFSLSSKLGSVRLSVIKGQGSRCLEQSGRQGGFSL
jgi:hypothetical protein